VAVAERANEIRNRPSSFVVGLIDMRDLLISRDG
jgi:hypothetical protein